MTRAPGATRWSYTPLTVDATPDAREDVRKVGRRFTTASWGKGLGPMDGGVVGVSRSATHTFGKSNRGSIRLLAGLGVEGDA